MSTKTAILWFRNDLRLHDHEALHCAMKRADHILPVYCLDPRHFETTGFGFPKTGAFRARFLLESLQVLRERLRGVGSDLLVLRGKPEELLPKLARDRGAYWIFAHQEVTSEEVAVEEKIERALFHDGITLELFWGSTLYHLADLPMPVSSLPQIFTQFRKQVEKMAEVRELYPTPDRIPTAKVEGPGPIPTLADLGFSEPEADPRSVLPYEGGEVAGLERLQSYFWEQDLLKTYKETRNGLLGADYSSKFSAWLALGCLSPRQIYYEVKRYEQLRKKNSSTYWLIFELIWRDYFRFVAKQAGNSLFFPGGIKGEISTWDQDTGRFEAWQQGQTGIPFIDANMRELLLTGFMSNRGRQNVASFLVKDLNLDWRLGAEWFESQLIDYDVCSNWGNWNYVAGIGNDPRENRYFNVVSQGRRYDPKAAYIRTWVPELEGLPADLAHEPYTAANSHLRSHGVTLGGSYPHPIVSFGRKMHRT